MRHLTDEQLVGLVLREPGQPEIRQAGDGVLHVRSCPSCRAKSEELRQAIEALRESRAVPPVSAWSQLKGRLERSCRPVRDWTEPRWAPLVFIHLGIVLFALVLVLGLAGWLSSSSVWNLVGRLPLIDRIGPGGLIALIFLTAGGFLVLALTPVLWLENRRRRHLCR
ncbi:MAG: hypothetical protein EHM61_19710 [Acidobacteria bacterium]|nr:MAG: hypothetical protein EHM61_19710 [Acidobacteriota bacterium]